MFARASRRGIFAKGQRYIHSPQKKNVKCKIQKLLTGCSRIFHRADDRNGLRDIIQRTGCGELRMLYSLWFVSHIVNLAVLSYSNMEIYFGINSSNWIFTGINGCHYNLIYSYVVIRKKYCALTFALFFCRIFIIARRKKQKNSRIVKYT